jgi:hypothetical protein
MPDFTQQTAQIKKLTFALAAASKAAAQGRADAGMKLDATLKLAEQLDWPALVEGLKRARDEERSKREVGLQSRREKLLVSARAAGEPFVDGERSVRVGVFRVEFEGESTVVSLGGVDVERTKEVDGERLYKRSKELRAWLEKSPFSRAEFFKQLQASYATCRRAGTTDEFVSVRDLHRELVLERARTNEAFRKRPEAKNVPDYPLHQFVFDLARFIQKGAAVGDDRLVTTTPAMRESASTVFIPNLDHPLANETPAARFAIKRNL